ncbi:hypothetical protein E1B28_005035 [Marasmius oreades]|uniref:Uncharacterized protein n=1 Tax=Marasmius oreades TaxID=181124 RepID=A0A9P7UZY1_9AGAR|nr:uncharacterized protein E1B28_005035 [Marasmius oreades]KAG7097711.1 hypothetical protein E1B28_005035 [Marasmius oreades]
MFSFAKKVPANWPSPLHHKCDNSKCTYPNSPKPAAGTYPCRGCTKGTYKVSRSTASAVDASSRQAFPLYARPTGHINAYAEQAAPRTLRDDIIQNVPLRTVGEIRTMKALESWGEPLSRAKAVRKRTGSGDSRTTTASSASGSGYSGRYGTASRSPPTTHQYTPTSSQDYYSSNLTPSRVAVPERPSGRPMRQYRIRNQ